MARKRKPLSKKFPGGNGTCAHCGKSTEVVNGTQEYAVYPRFCSPKCYLAFMKKEEDGK
jgi:hypothetical protein